MQRALTSGEPSTQYITPFREQRRETVKEMFPRNSNRNGFLKNTLVNANERRGNMFLFLCICHTSTIENILCPKLREHGISLFEMKECLKLYLAMDEWFHDTNPKEEVRNAREMIGHTIDAVKIPPPRDGNGWN